MTRTHSQQMGDMHEAEMATWIKGHLSRSSGNQWHDQMDTKNGSRDVSFPMAGDGKSTCNKGMGLTREMWEKARRQAGALLTPFLALRWYEDTSLDRVGLDLVVLESDAFVRLLNAARAWEDHVAAHPPHADDLSGCDCCR